MQLKHRFVAQALLKEIESGRWISEERLPAEIELAAQYHVAPMTMRQAIANLVDDGVLVRVRGKGTYVVPSSVQADKAAQLHPMGLLFPSNALQVDPYYFPEVLQGFQQGVEQAGLHVPLYGDDMIDIEHAFPAGSNVACLLCEDKQSRLVEKLRDHGVTVLAINRYPGRRAIPSVYIDDASGIVNAVDHLAALGHERIGFICGQLRNLDAIERLRGFRRAIKKHRIRTAPEIGDGFNESEGYSAAVQMLTQSNRPTAIVCASDLAAIGAIKAARDLGLSIPTGLSVVGFGDFSVADYMMPALTTVRQARLALGKCAASALIDLAAGRETKNIVLSPDLIIRQSTAAAGALRI